MTENRCRDCVYYVQHYALDEDGKLGYVYCGHCRQTVKARKPDKPVCDMFVQRQDETDRYVTKEYLKKELLQRVLDMELLPEEIVFSEIVK